MRHNLGCTCDTGQSNSTVIAMEMSKGPAMVGIPAQCAPQAQHTLAGTSLERFRKMQGDDVVLLWNKAPMGICAPLYSMPKAPAGWGIQIS